MSAIYNAIYTIFSYPFGYALNLLYNINGKNYLAAIIIFAVIIKLILLPSSIKQQKNTTKSQRMNKRLQKIRDKYANDQQAQNEAVQEFYQKEGFSSMSAGCGSLAIQFPILMGLYGAIYHPLKYILQIDFKSHYGKGTIDALTAAVTKFLGDSATSRTQTMAEILVVNNATKLKDAIISIGGDKGEQLYAEISDFASHFTAMGFGFGDIPKELWNAGTKSVVIVPILAFAGAMISSIYSLVHQKKMPGNTQQNMMSMGCMMLTMPLMSLWLAFTFPVGLGIYWAVNSILSFIQMLVLDIVYPPNRVVAEVLVEESIVRKEKEVVSKNAAAYEAK